MTHSPNTTNDPHVSEWLGPGKGWWFCSDWDPDTETGDEMVGPFDSADEARRAARAG